jgi:hypothetical protein
LKRNPVSALRFGVFVAGTFAFLFLPGNRLNVQARAPQNGTRSPVLVELFTSEGCSDCPPADAFLAALDQSQPVPYAQLIVLSEHVDYWDSGGWRDPYSSHDLTMRQQDYVDHLHLQTAYTPQMVIDGNAQLVGSDQKTAFADIEKAAAMHMVPIRLTDIGANGDKHVRMQIDIGPGAAPADNISGDVWVALADDSDQSNVKAGENAGHVLSNVAVVRHLNRVGSVHEGIFSAARSLPTEGANLHNLRIVAFVQQGLGAKIVALGSGRLPN